VLTGDYADPITALRADLAPAQAEGREVGLDLGTANDLSKPDA